MDFAWSPELVSLREEARKLAAEGVARYGRHNDSWINGYSKEFSRELAARGWIGMTWPVEVGGGGRPPIERLIVGDEMISAGVLVAAEGLDDAADGVVIDFSSQPPVVSDGPYGETKELFGGFWILDVASKEEAVEWAKRAPLTGPGQKTEIRRVTSIDEFPQDNEWIQKERAWRERTGQL